MHIRWSQFPAGNLPLASHEMQTPLWFNGDFPLSGSVLIWSRSGPSSPRLATTSLPENTTAGTFHLLFFCPECFPPSSSHGGLLLALRIPVWLSSPERTSCVIQRFSALLLYLVWFKLPVVTFLTHITHSFCACLLTASPHPDVNSSLVHCRLLNS